LTRWPSRARNSDSHTAIPRWNPANKPIAPASATTYIIAKCLSEGACVSAASTTVSTIIFPSHATTAGINPAANTSAIIASDSPRCVVHTSPSARPLYRNTPKYRRGLLALEPAGAGGTWEEIMPIPFLANKIQLCYQSYIHTIK
jgi:hypothetical protein